MRRAGFNYFVFLSLFVNIFAQSDEKPLPVPVLVPVISPLHEWTLVQETDSRAKASNLKRVTLRPISSPNFGPKRVARRLSPNISSTPVSDSAPPPNSNSNSSLAPTGLVQPPESPHTACCGPNMIPRRTNLKTCVLSNCVYPIKLEFFLKNVSLTSNFSNRFLDALSEQLSLKSDQFQIDNFYVVGASGLNISMDVVPEKRESFGRVEVLRLNDLLANHKIKINPDLVGDYILLNFTWFQSPAPTPAPTMSISPMASPPSKVPHLPTPSTDSKDNANKINNHSNLLIIIGICVGLLIVIFITIMVICACSYGKSRNTTEEEVDTPKPLPPRDTMSACGSLPRPTSTRFLSLEELSLATNNFDPCTLLGEGGFGRVYKGVLSDGTAVAIKRLTSGGHQGDKEFLVEVEMLSRLHHRNLVKLVGFYGDKDTEMSLLCYELVPNGSLEAWLHGPIETTNYPLDWQTRMKIALDAARGLAYLHEDSQPCVIHRDFKSSNILLENDFHAKVSDFGLAKLAPEGQANHLSTRVMGTFGYVAPEYAMTGHLLVKSDVYSYGVVLLELITGKRPVDHLQPLGQENLVTWARPILRDKERLAELADPRMVGNYPRDDFIRVCTIAAACVSLEANQRPTMGEVVQSLKMVQSNNNNNTSSNNNNNDNNVNVDSNNNNNVNGSGNNNNNNYESDGTSSMFSSSPFSGLSFLENDNVIRTMVFSEDLHEGR